MMTGTILKTENEDWGFWGTMCTAGYDSRIAWPIAFEQVMRATDGSPEAVRDWLDSSSGRHFADEVTNHLVAGLTMAEAIERAVGVWMTWKVGRRAPQELAPARGMPLLWAEVMLAEMSD